MLGFNQACRSAVLLVLLCLLQGLALGQTSHSKDAAPKGKPDSTAKSESSLLQGFESETKGQDTGRLKKALGDELVLQQKMNELEIKKQLYLMKSLDHRAGVFAWQHVASIVIFFVVMVIVITGLVLSIMHFYKDLKKRNPASTELEVNMQGIKITSSIVGLLILALSTAFFYLYLIYVFPIKEINIDMSISPTQFKEVKQ
jgi:hypothetical protein